MKNRISRLTLLAAAVCAVFSVCYLGFVPDLPREGIEEKADFGDGNPVKATEIDQREQQELASLPFPEQGPTDEIPVIAGESAGLPSAPKVGVMRQLAQQMAGNRPPEFEPALRDPSMYAFVSVLEHDGRIAQRAINPLNSLEAEFTSDGVRLFAGGGYPFNVTEGEIGNECEKRLEARFTRYGVQGAMEMADTQEFSGEGERLERRHGSGLVEWWLNTAEGFEHGFIVEAPPVGAVQSSLLRFEIELESPFSPVFDEERQELIFQTETGKRALTYDKLLAMDAEGEELPARFDLGGSRESDDGNEIVELALVVDASSATYPLLIDPTISSQLVKDINDDMTHTVLPVEVGGKLFFEAFSESEGFELWVSDGTAEGIFRLTDITPGAESSFPRQLTAVGSMLYFTAYNPTTGRELWMSDGTTSGTVLAKDIYAGEGSGNPQDLIAVDSTLYFSAYTPTTGYELWKSNGASSGTVLVKDIYAGEGSGNPRRLTVVGSTLYFSAYGHDGTTNTGRELWKSDGTTSGTVLLKDIYIGVKWGEAYHLTAVESTLYFSAFGYDGSTWTGWELWKSDGTSEGTVLVKDVYAGWGSSNPYDLTAVGSTLYFSASGYDGTTRTGHELWKSDGISEGTVLVKDVYAGEGSGYPQDLIAVGSTLYFIANGFDGTIRTGYELWRSDGTSEGTVLLKDVYVGNASGYPPQNLTAVGSKLYFSAYIPTIGRELWKSDGTSEGTVLVKDIYAGEGSGDPQNLTAVDSTLCFVANGYDGETPTGRELWKSDGTSEGTVLVKDVNAGEGSGNPRYLTLVGSTLYFQSNNFDHTTSLWKSDGTSSGTVKVSDILVHTHTSSPRYLTAVGSTLYFSASTSATGNELWKSDGTSEGTVLVKDVYPGWVSGGPQNITAVGETLYFSASNPTTGYELWKSDGTSEGTVLVKDIIAEGGSSFPRHLTAVDSTLYFSANGYDGASLTGHELWKSDGTSEGTVLVKDVYAGEGSSDPQYLTAVGPTLYFSAYNPTTGWELWRSDGTPGGTVLVEDVYAGVGSGRPQALTAVGSTLYFSSFGYDGTTYTGRELWKSDSTSEGAVLVKDLVAGFGSGNPYNLTAVDSTLYFGAYGYDGTTGTGYELWKSDGTSSGTVMVKDIYPGWGSGGPRDLTVVGSTLYFSAYNVTTGYELWKSDGTSLGTVLVKDIYVGEGSSDPRHLAAVGSTLYYSAYGYDGTTHTGNELWKSDGTMEGTELVEDLHAGLNSSSPSDLYLLGNKLFFTADNGQHGIELRVINLSTTPRIDAITPSVAPTSGGVAVTIDGSDFGSSPTVFIGGIGAEIVSATETQITVIAPSLPFGSKDVIVNDGSATSESFEINYERVSPGLSWEQPSPIVYGAVLGAEQLNATAEVAGTLSYSPPAGSVLPAGSSQALTVEFMPDAPDYYLNETADQSIDVSPASLLVTAGDQNREYGDANPKFTVSYSGFVLGEGPDVLDPKPFASTGADKDSNVGEYPIVARGGSSPNYTLSYTDGVLTITPASLIIRADDQTKSYGDANPPLTASYTGFKNSETTAVLTGDPVLSTNSDDSSYVGVYPISITAGTLESLNYEFSLLGGSLEVLPVPLTVRISNPESGFLQQVDQLIDFNGSFSPTGREGSYQAMWSFSSSSLTESIDISGSILGSGRTDIDYVELATAFSVPGIYSVTLTVQDPLGVIATTSILLEDIDNDAFVVIYDPNGGFVTGGGWIWSPSGAYAFDASLEGRANFGFVSKYKKGASVPIGNTEFHFKAGGLRFKSDSYDWLVVAGSNAKFKGVGSINGIDDFGFMITASDRDSKSSDDPDRFRIKIWDLVTEEVVYDNQMGADDDAALTFETIIQGGNISVKSR